MLHNYQRAKISDVFGCPVVNRYGLAEAGVVAYQMDLDGSDMRVMSHLAHFKCEASGAVEDVCITTLRNRAMPLINYQPGDLARFRRDSSGELHISAIEGRIHDQFTVGGVTVMSHSLMDVLDHRVGGVKEFQVHRSRSTNHVKLLVVPESQLDAQAVETVVERYIGARLPVVVADASDLVRVGWRQKFKHLVDVD
jgi:phenylacetate-CoA ligase